MELKEKDKIGTILSGTDSRKALFQLIKKYERSESIFEGMIVLIYIRDVKNMVLARIDRILPHNEIFVKGDFFSQARKEPVELPTDFAQTYVNVEAQILLNISDFGSVTIPPSPGDPVYLIDEEKAEEFLFKSSRNKTNIKFGYMHGYRPSKNKSGIAIPLEIDKLPMHLGIFGVTGSGKSYSTGALLEKIMSIQYKDKGEIKGTITYPTIIIDAHGDYLSYFRHAKENNFGKSNDLEFELKKIKHYVFPTVYRQMRKEGKNMFNINPISVNFNLLEPREIAEMIVLFYHGEFGLGERQVTSLAQALKVIKEKFEKNKENPAEVFDFNKLFETDDGIKKIIKSLVTKDKERQNLEEDEYVYTVAATKSAVERILAKFCAEVEGKHKLLSTDSPFTKESFIDEIIKSGYINIIDFSTKGSASAEVSIKQFIMSYLATILFNRFRSYVMQGQKYHLLFLIEEAQIFCPSSSYNIGASLAKEKIRAIATQGRKFGLSLGIITQRPSFVDPIVLSMINTFIIHRIAAADESVVSTIAGGLPSSTVSKLTSLKTGNFILAGQMNFLPFALWGEIVKGYDRKIAPDVGEVIPSEDLYSLQNIPNED